MSHHEGTQLTASGDTRARTHLRQRDLSPSAADGIAQRAGVALDMPQWTARPTFHEDIPMRTASSSPTPALSHTLYMALAILTAFVVFLAAPRPAAAQDSPLRVLAERVLEERNGIYDRGGIYDRDSRSRREREQWERERAAREAYCRRNRNDRRCDGGWNGSYGRYETERRGAWCLDRDRNNRCDATSSRRDNGRHRGWEKDRKRDRGNGRW